MAENCLYKDGKKIGVLVGIVAGLYVLFRYVLPVVFPFLLAGIVAVSYYPFLNRIWDLDGRSQKKRWIISLWTILLYIVMVVGFGVIVCFLIKQFSEFVLNLPFYQAKIVHVVKNCCGQVDSVFMMEPGSSYTQLSHLFHDGFGEKIAPMIQKITTGSFYVAKELFDVIFGLVVTAISTIFILQDYEKIHEWILKSRLGEEISRSYCRLKDTFFTYIKAQGFIMLLNGIVCGIAFLLIGKSSALLWGFLLAVIDMLPVFGVGIVLIPYVFVMFVSKQFWKGFILLLAYVGCVTIRQITEPKMIGNKIGILPVCTMLFMYVGFRLFGVAGFLLGPAGFLIGRELYRIICEKMKL